MWMRNILFAKQITSVSFTLIFLCIIGITGFVSGGTTLTQDTITSNGNNLYFTAIGSDEAGNPFIFSDGRLYHKEGDLWVTNEVNPLAQFGPSIVVDKEENVHIFYSKAITSNNYALYHAKWNSTIPAGSTCLMEQLRTRPVDAPNNPEYGYADKSDAIVDSEGNIHLVYAYTYGNWGLLYTEHDPSGWGIPVRVHQGYMWISDFSLKTDENDNLYASFINLYQWDDPQGNLKGLYFGQKTPSGNWVTTPIIQGDTISGTALVIDQGIVRIVYGYKNATTNKNEIKMASRKIDGTWMHELLLNEVPGGINSLDAEVLNGVLFVVSGVGSTSNLQPILITKNLPDGIPSYQWFGPENSNERADVAISKSSQTLHISHNYNRNTLIYTTVKITNEPPIALINGPYIAKERCSSVTFTAEGSSDPEGAPLQYRWSFNNGNSWTTWSNSPIKLESWDDDYFSTILLEVSDGVNIVQASTTLSIENVAPAVMIMPIPALVVTAEVNEAQAQNTIDGNWNTYWEGAGESPRWIKFDLGKISTVSGFRETSGGFPPNMAHVLVSSDDITYTPVYDGLLTGCVMGEHSFAQIEARYIKLVLDWNGDSGYGELAEFQVIEEGNLVSAEVGDAITFTGLAPDPAPADANHQTYTWNFGDGVITTGSSSATHIYKSATTFLVTLTVSDGDGSGSASRTVFIHDTAAPEFGSEVPASGSMVTTVPDSGFVVSASDNSGTATVSYAVSGAGTASGSGTNTVTIPADTFTTPGVYTVTVTATDAAGNSVTSSFTVQIADTAAPEFGSEVPASGSMV
ncbi:MAG TPA: PKD domain-containing protein, partial [Methanolinea sp.]|nr:PKD domain-containing protein [Methanolinea sp.]